MSHSMLLRHPVTPAGLLIGALRRHGTKTAIIHDGEQFSYGYLADQISRYMQVWQHCGMPEGSRVAVLSPNRVELVIAMCAALVSGVVWVPLHPLGSLDDHMFMIKDAGAETLLYDLEHYHDRAAALAKCAAGIKRTIALARTDECENMAHAAAAFAGSALTAAAAGVSNAAWIAYTGGTTGRPKGVVATNRGLTAMTAIQLAEWEWPDELRLLCTTPLSHAAGTLVLPTLVRGGALVLTESFDPAHFLELVARHRITSTLLVPTMIYRLLEHDLESADLTSLQTVFYGASPISRVQLSEALDRIGPIFFQFYGQSEAPTTVSVLRKRDHLGTDERRITSCGQPVPWLDVAILDEEGRPVPVGERGEICVRGPLVMAGYLNRPDETAEAFRHGWLHTGDVATEDDAGFLTIVDRRKDIIISGGFNIFPREVEDVLHVHPAVLDCAVIGVPHPIWGEAVKAIVVRRSGASIAAAELIDFVKRHKGAAAAPKSVDFVTAIPLSPLGKPNKRILRAQYWTDCDRNVN